MIGGFVGGWLDNRLGSKRAIFISIGGTTIFCLLSLTMAPDRIFWFIPYDVHAAPVWSFSFFNTLAELFYMMLVNFIAVLITAGYANSRTMLARIAPVEKMTEFFGLYSLSGLSTTFLATGFVSLLTLLSHSQRIGLLGETLFLSMGLVLMFFVREERAGSGVMADVEHLIAAEAGAAELSAEGVPTASRLGQWAWALYEGARDPNIVFQIYVISPFFATVMIRDPIRGQELWGDVTAYSGHITAALCPFFGAIADRGGPRKPWLALFTLLMVLSFAGHSGSGTANAPPSIVWIVSAAVVINNIVFEFSNAFHGAMLSRIAPLNRIGGLSGLSFALGSGAGGLLLLVFLLAFVMPHPWFPLDEAARVPERLSGSGHGGMDAGIRAAICSSPPTRPRSGVPVMRAVRDGIAAVIATVKSLRHYSNVAHYIGARAVQRRAYGRASPSACIICRGHLSLGRYGDGAVRNRAGVLRHARRILGGVLDEAAWARSALLLSIGGAALFFALGLTMGPDRVLWFLPAAPGARLPLILYAVFSCLMAMFVVAGLRQQPHNARAHRADREDDRVLRPDVTVGHGGDVFLAPIGLSQMTGWTHSQRGGMIAIVALLVLGWLWMFKVREERATAV